MNTKAPSNNPADRIKTLTAEESQIGEMLGRLNALGKGSTTVTYTVNGVRESVELNRLSIAAALKSKLNSLEQAKGLLQSVVDRANPKK